MCQSLKRDLFFEIFGPANLELDAKSTFLQRQDLEVLISLFQTFKPKTVIEIGIQKGSTAKILLANGPWVEKYIGIDITPDSTPPLKVQYEEVPLKAGELILDDPRIEILVKPNGTRDLTATDLPAADFIFIDGDHSENGVLYDTRLARQVIRAGGIICWHDYDHSPVPDVTKVIDKLNIIEGNHICLVEDTMVCFEFRSDGR